MQKKSNAIRTISFLLCVSVVSLSAALYYRYKADGLTLQVEQHQHHICMPVKKSKNMFRFQ